MATTPHGTVGSVQTGVVRSRALPDAVRRVGWPLLVVAGLAQVAFCLGPWGASADKAGATITGLGRVSVPGADRVDVAFLEVHTQRPAVTALICGALVVFAGLYGWWQRRRRWIPLAVTVVAALASLIGTVPAVVDPTGSLLDRSVTAVLGGDTSLRLGYGSVVVLVLTVLTLAGTLGALVSAGITSSRRDPTQVTPSE